MSTFLQESIHNYNGDYNQASGGFTQLVWKGSREFGSAKAVAPNGWVYIVAIFNPHGNVVGQFANNVFPSSNRVQYSQNYPANSIYSRQSMTKD